MLLPGCHQPLTHTNPCPSSFKRVIAAWRVLVGVWAPKRWDLSLAALAPYTTPVVPPESPWVDRRQRSSTPDLPAQATEPPVMLKRKAPASRRIMRHVLRARGEAVRALAGFFTALEEGGDKQRVVASPHLARRFGWVEEVAAEEEKGYRHAGEVVSFLRSRGAKIATLEREIEGGWAGLVSEEDVTPGGSDAGGDEDDMVWVARERQPRMAD